MTHPFQVCHLRIFLTLCLATPTISNATVFAESPPNIVIIFMNVVDQQPEVVAGLQALAKSMQADLGEGQQRGAGQRAVGRIDQSETKSQ